MTENKNNKWRQHLININYSPQDKMTDEQISNMLFRPGKVYNAFLKWIVNKLSGNETKVEILEEICKHIYIPTKFQNGFIEGNMMHQKKLHSNIWTAIFEELENRKVTHIPKSISLEDFSNLNVSDVLEKLENKDFDNLNIGLEDELFFQQDFKLNGNQDDNVSQNEGLSTETVELITLVNQTCEEVKKFLFSNEANKRESFTFTQYFEPVIEFFEENKNDIKTLIEENNLSRNFMELESQLVNILPSLCSSYSSLEKYSEDGETIMNCLKKLEELNINHSDLEANSDREYFNEIFSNLLAYFQSKNEIASVSGSPTDC